MNRRVWALLLTAMVVTGIATDYLVDLTLPPAGAKC